MGRCTYLSSYLTFSVEIANAFEMVPSGFTSYTLADQRSEAQC